MFYNDKELEDIHYTCSMVEFLSEQTTNKPLDIINYLSPQGLEWLLNNAETCHCMAFELMSERLIKRFGIEYGCIEPKKHILPYIDRGEIYKVIAVGLSYHYKLPILEAIQKAFTFDCPV